MSHTTKFPLTDALKEAFNKNDKTNRFLKVQIVNETYELVTEKPLTQAASHDFEPVAQSLLEKSTPCFLLFREKSWGSKAWGFITYMPNDAPVAQRMLYGTGAVALREALGHDNFGTDKVFSEPAEFTWNNYKGFESTSTADKPWSQRELAAMQLDKAEAEARNEYLARNKEPRAASGFHTVLIPLSEEANATVEAYKAGTHNWLELTLDDAQKTLNVTASKTVSGDLSANVDPKEPHFYLYNFNGTHVLIYSCPDGASMKNRMAYPTCKSGVADQLKSNHGLQPVKKLDIRSPGDLTLETLRTQVASRSSGLFKPDAKMMDPKPVAGAPASRTTNTGFDKQQFNSNLPVFNRAGFNKPVEDDADGDRHSNIPSRMPKNTNAPSAMRVLIGGTPKKTPKGVVLPPEGAYM